jgi:nitrogen-specific signal transduction histidine kinase
MTLDKMTQSKSAVAESWLETSDAVLRGLNHEFSNRLSLARLSPQLSALLASGEPGMQQVAADVDRSEDLLHLLRLYRLMVFASSEQAEPVLVSDIVVDSVDLFKHHTTFRDLDVRVIPDTTIPPVLMSPGALTQAVLLLLCAAARQVSLARGDTGVLVVNLSADANSVHIAVSADEAGAKAGGDGPPEFPALRYLIRDVNGSAEITPVGATLSIGTLVSLRQREKRG